jgi:phosphatidylserine/phosphatidylglycerophosphate/cardiolipin synthase-like enzyme
MVRFPLPFRSLAFALTTLALASACSQEVETNEADQTEGTPGLKVLAQLKQFHSEEEGSAWSVSTNNVLHGEWIQEMPVAATWDQADLVSPPVCKSNAASCDLDFQLARCKTDADCSRGTRCAALRSTIAHDGATATSLCIGHSDTRLDDIYDIIVGAKRAVDVTSLTPPDGRFEAAVRNAVTRISERTAPPSVRMLFGDYPGEFYSSDKTLQRLSRDVASSSVLRMVVGGYRAKVTSWNHSKMVAADGKIVLSGGTNMWTSHYLGSNAVRDLSMRIEGQAAADAQSYANKLWEYTCRDGSIKGIGETKGCIEPFSEVHTSTPKPAGSRVITVGRYGKIGTDPSDDALLYLLDSAESSLTIAQQDLGPIKRAGVSFDAWPTPVLGALLRAMIRGVRIEFVLSNLGSEGGTPNVFTALAATYSNGWTLEDVRTALVKYAAKHPKIGTEAEVERALCTNLKLYNLRSSTSDQWKNGKALALHSKVIIVDHKTFYLGSQNLYVADLAEFGFIVDDAKAARELEETYFGPMLKYSGRTVYVAPSCK